MCIAIKVYIEDVSSDHWALMTLAERKQFLTDNVEKALRRCPDNRTMNIIDANGNKIGHVAVAEPFVHKLVAERV